MPKLGLTIMSVIAMAVVATSCGRGEEDLLSTIDPRAETTALHLAAADAILAEAAIRPTAARSPS